MAKIAVIYYSGYGHTEKLASVLIEGIKSIDGISVDAIKINAEGVVSDEEMAILDAADTIVYGSPTYMGGPAWQFKRFADHSSHTWFQRKWQDKLAAGFSVSASPVGDKGQTISYFQTLASQHGQIWISLGLLPSNKMESTSDDVNYLGGSVGLIARAPSDVGPDLGPLKGDLETAKLFGARISTITKKYIG